MKDTLFSENFSVLLRIAALNMFTYLSQAFAAYPIPLVGEKMR